MGVDNPSPKKNQRSIDGGTTKHCHQVFSAEWLAELDRYIIHYSVCCPTIDKDPCDIVPNRFIETLTDTRGDDHDVALASERPYSLFMSELRRGLAKRKGYEIGTPMPSVTYDLGFDKNHNFVSFDIRATTIEMTESLTDLQATNLMHGEPEDIEIRILHDCALAARRNIFLEALDKPELHFADVTTTLSDIIKAETYKKAKENSIDCVFRASPFEKPLARLDMQIPKRKSVKSCYYQFGSVLSDNDLPQLSLCAEGSRNIISATASRNGMDLYNESVLYMFHNNGANPFPEGTSQAFAMYHDRLARLRRDRVFQA